MIGSKIEGGKVITDNAKLRTTKFAWALLSVGLFIGSPVLAQQGSASVQNSSQQEQSVAQTTSASADDSISPSDNSAPIAAVVLTPVPVRTIGKASLLDTSSQLRWGNLSVGTISYLQAYQQLSPTGGLPGLNNNISLFTTDVIYAKEFQRSRVALQYQPRGMVVNGQAVSNLLNQDLAVDTYFILSPRWSLGLGDNLVYEKNRNVVGESLLDIDTVTATTLQNNFLEGTGTYLSESVNSTFNYAWSPRTKFAVTPSFTYSAISGLGASAQPLSSRSYSVEATLSHALSERTFLGVYQRDQVLTSSNAFGRTIYEEAGASFSHQFGTTWHVAASMGVTTANFSSGRQWNESFSGNLMKSFQRSSIAVDYTRGQVLTGYITNHYGDRVDVIYRTRLTRRLGYGAGMGYQRDITGLSNIWGKYASGDVGYQLTRSLSWVGNYVHKWQRANDAQLFDGDENLVVVGLAWDPRPNSR